MTQEDKELLLRDLCARLPYGIEADCVGEYVKIKYIDPHRSTAYISNLGKTKWESIEVITPYLRPMSSMTDKELVEFLGIRGMNLNSEQLKTFREGQMAIVSTLPSYSRHINWLIAHHFDYRGLIERGLAIKITEKK